MKYLPFFTYLFLATALTAQITVTNATFPSAGDTLRYRTDNNPPALNLGTAGGANQVWDFSALQGGPVQATAWLAATGGSGAANFPSANLRTGTQASEVFYRKTASTLQNLGSTGADLLNLGINTTIQYQPPLPERRGPQQFFDIHTVESNLSWAVPTGALADSLLGQLGGLVDSFRFRIHTARLDVVDAWGTCHLLGGSFPVLREKRTTTTETSIDVHSFLGWTDLSALLGSGGSGLLNNIGKDTTIALHFFSGTEKEEIAVVTLNDAGTAAQSVRYKYLPSTVSTADVSVGKPMMRAWPNPAQAYVLLEPRYWAEGDYQVMVRDLSGRLLLQQSLRVDTGGAAPIDIAALPSGCLVIQLLNSTGQSMALEKVIKN